MNFLRAADIHAMIGRRWPEILSAWIPEEYLSKKNGPCLRCGGHDRYFFSNKFGRGDWFCRQCSPMVGGQQRNGDGFELLRIAMGWDFSTARKHVLAAVGLETAEITGNRPKPLFHPTCSPAQPSERATRICGGVVPLQQVSDAKAYVISRKIWPAAARTSLRAHPGVDYYQGGEKIGMFPALIAAVRDLEGELVTIHVTYLKAGQKLRGHDPRKILSPMTGREGCAVRLQPLVDDCLGIAEGIETSISAGLLHRMPVWAALNTGMLGKFVPPPQVRRLVIFADADGPGLAAAARLTEELQPRLTVEVRTPPMHKDWNDALRAS